MAKRLRNKVPGMTTCASLETIAAVLGYRNWDTLHGTLKAQAEAPATKTAPLRSEEFRTRARLVNYRETAPTGFQPFTLVCAVSALDDWADSPDCYRMEITEEVVAHLHELQTMCLDTGLDLAEDGEQLGEWLSTSFMNMRHDRLHVNERRFYLSARPKHGDATSTVESRAIDFDELFDLIENGKNAKSNAEYFAWAGNVLVRDAGSARQLAESLRDDGHLELEDSDLDSMP